jgi:protocatechuate 3,4-dioxygenase, alpha subunit
VPEPTPPQTVGPFFAPALIRERWNVLAGPGAVGERCRVEGTVCDGDGSPVDDAMIEIWQANAAGRYRHPSDERDVKLDEAFVGFGRAGTDRDGRFWFETVRPGPVPSPAGGWQAPHLNVQVFARGLLDRVSTRLYFDDESANAQDPVLGSLPEDRRATLIARRTDAGPPPVYRFDVVLQGDGETVFFDL